MVFEANSCKPTVEVEMVHSLSKDIPNGTRGIAALDVTSPGLHTAYFENGFTAYVYAKESLKLDIKSVCEVTATRHDVVHRNGKDKDGNEINIDRNCTLDALAAIEEFVSALQRSL